MNLLGGRVAIVTGGASGIGRASAELFAREAAAVVVADINEDEGREVATNFISQGLTVEFFPTDVTKSEQVEQLVATTVERHGRLDILFNNAGIEGPIGNKLADTSIDSWLRIIEVNLTGVFLGMKAAIPQMLRQGGGTIINSASLAGLVGVSQLAAYSASKGGIVQLTKAAALEYATENIRINCICPGRTATPMLSRIGEARAAAGIPSRPGRGNPMDRNAAPGEIAAAALLLASDLSSFITGVALPVDGGAFAE